MSIYDLYSRRKRKNNSDENNIYQYDSLQKQLKIQVYHILITTLGEEYSHQNVKELYRELVSILRKEYGVFKLPFTNSSLRDSPQKELFDFFINSPEIDHCLDVIELAFRAVDFVTRRIAYRHIRDADRIADDAIYELNERFKEHAVGYQYSNGNIIRIDSEFIHTETVKPALSLLGNEIYRGAQQEFLLAHKHYRHGDAKEALNECLKAFESTLKIICDKRGWSYSPNAAAKALLTICFENNLIPSFWQDHYNCLQKMLENGVPTGRNKLSGHGQGSEIINIPNSIVAYMLHMTASAIVFLAESEAALP